MSSDNKGIGSPDDLQRAWKEHLSETRVSVNAELLKNEVELDRSSFRSVIMSRDIQEISVSVLLIPVWIVLASIVPVPWTWYLAIPSLVGVPAFMLWHRWRNFRPEKADETLVESIRRSIAEQEDQIWLLRNVAWWYLLPFGIPILIFFAHVAWDSSSAGAVFAILFFLVMAGGVTAVYVGIYWMNQAAVRNKLIPKRDALLAVLTTMTDQSAMDEENVSLSVSAVASLSETKSEPAPEFSLIGTIVGLVLFLLIMWGIAQFLGFATDNPSYLEDKIRAARDHSSHEKRSPFDAIRWNEERMPEVKLDSEWYRLVALDDLPANRIVAFARQTYRDRYRQRFEEDLVQVLSEMGSIPGQRVKLELQPMDSSKTVVRSGVPMTRAKRQAIFKANGD